METRNAILAVVLSLAILLGYQYFFVAPPQEATRQEQQVVREQEGAGNAVQETAPQVAAQPAVVSAVAPVTASALAGREIPVETALYSAVFSEGGGVVKSFRLTQYRETMDKDSDAKELITTDPAFGLPLAFNWGGAPQYSGLEVLSADRTSVRTAAGESVTLTMAGGLSNGLHITKSFVFYDQDYRVKMAVTVKNTTQTALQGAPFLSLLNEPFSLENGNKGTFLFHGPAVFADGQLVEVKLDDLRKNSFTQQGTIDWMAYEDTYFMCGLLPDKKAGTRVQFSIGNNDRVTSVLSSDAEVIPPGGELRYEYTVYIGPKRLGDLEAVGNNLDRIVDFGWFDLLARPTLYFLNFVHEYIPNYGIAIILVTIVIKAAFWPIAQKGMKSMKTMQKIQPKMAKLREKHKDDKERLNQEMIKLYQTYKVNPVGGCLPMVLQIPVFFALYKVLLQAIELRHAPFMLWINDLSAPDRLHIGFDLPVLGGIPVLTLMMGASMFLQQKMTPTTGDPTQAKIMMFLPVIFTFMFINFASGLVLYWFVNNLLSIAQQYAINRQVD